MWGMVSEKTNFSFGHYTNILLIFLVSFSQLADEYSLSLSLSLLISQIRNQKNSSWLWSHQTTVTRSITLVKIANKLIYTIKFSSQRFFFLFFGKGTYWLDNWNQLTANPLKRRCGCFPSLSFLLLKDERMPFPHLFFADEYAKLILKFPRKKWGHIPFF